MAKLVCHGEKYTKGAISKIERHNERQNEHYGNPDIDKERSHLNYRLMECKEKNYFAAIMKLVDARNNPTGKKLRKDAVVLTEFIISSGNDFFETLSPERQKEYFRVSLEYLENLFGKKNTIYAVVHNDEHTPHMHFGFVPMTEDNRVCAKAVINRNILRQIQDELPKHLQKAGFDIERGEVNSEAVHRTVKQYKADMEKEKAELSTVIKEQKQELHMIAKKKTDIRSLDEIATGKTLLGGKVTVEETDYKRLTDLAKKQIAVEKSTKKLKEENATLRKANQELKASNESLSAKLSSEQSMSRRLGIKKLETEVIELRKFKQLAETFLAERGLKDYFQKAFIHSNKRDILE
jgi:hypothetical protein